MKEELVRSESVASQDIYQSYFEGMPGLVTVQDRDLRIIDANRAFKNSFRAPNGAHCWEVYKGVHGQCPDCPVHETFVTGKSVRCEETYVNAEGESVPVLVYTAPVPDASGDVSKVIKVSTDMTDVKRLQKKLHKTQLGLRHLFDESPCYISVQDADFHITDANRRFKDDFGDEIGSYCYEVYKHRNEPCLDCPVAKTFDDGCIHRSEEVVTSGSGEQINVLVQTAPIRNGNGELTHVMEMSTNITQLRQLETQLTSLGLLVSSISHSIKGTLAALDGGMYIVNSGFKRGDQGRISEGWEIVQRNVNQVRSMVLDILYYAKDRKLELIKFNPQALVEELVSKFSHTAGEHDIGLKCESHPGVPEIEADENALRSALINVVENAIDACRVDDHKSTHSVWLSLREDDSHVIFDIKDNGIGMDRETREKVFSLFFSSKGTEGTGLGLFISNKIVQQHGGRIELESTLDLGSQFKIWIPKKPSTSPSRSESGKNSGLLSEPLG